MEKAIELCRIFNCSLDNLFREEMDKRMDAYSNLRVEEVEGFSYVEHTVISNDPEEDALSWIDRLSGKNGVTNPCVIGWDFPNISVEQMNVYHMHGYTAAWVLPVGIQPEGLEIKVQPKHRYAAVHVENPFENPFVTIPSAYQTLDSFMRVNGLVHTESGVIPCYETNGESMDIYIACE